MTKYAQKMCQIISSSRQHMTAEQIFDALRQAWQRAQHHSGHAKPDWRLSARLELEKIRL